MVFSLEHGIKVTKSHQNVLPTQSVIVAHTVVICIARLRNPTLTNREKNCRQGRFAAETRQSQGRQRIS
jgi:hypothetical protein